MNFFVLAIDNPDIIVNFLSYYYKITESIDKELVQLTYYGHLSFIDACLMNFYQRRFWIKEISNIIEKQNPVDGTDINSL